MDPETAYDTYFVPQGISADLIATIEGFSREDCDALAVQSQDRAAMAWSSGRFTKSVVPVKDRNGVTILDHDEHMRPGTTLADLGSLKPSFAGIGEMGGFDAVALQKFHWVEKINHVHTPGNSSGIVDGAALVLVGNEAVGKQFGMVPRARVVATAVSGADPTIMLTGPTPATQKALDTAGLTVDDIDVWELNEAFAAVVLKWVRTSTCRWRRSTSTAARWPWATRWGHRRHDPGHRRRRAGAVRWPLRPGDAVHRRRYGPGHHHRARLSRGENERTSK